MQLILGITLAVAIAIALGSMLGLRSPIGNRSANQQRTPTSVFSSPNPATNPTTAAPNGNNVPVATPTATVSPDPRDTTVPPSRTETFPTDSADNTTRTANTNTTNTDATNADGVNAEEDITLRALW